MQMHIPALSQILVVSAFLEKRLVCGHLCCFHPWWFPSPKCLMCLLLMLEFQILWTHLQRGKNPNQADQLQLPHILVQQTRRYDQLHNKQISNRQQVFIFIYLLRQVVIPQCWRIWQKVKPKLPNVTCTENHRLSVKHKQSHQRIHSLFFMPWTVFHIQEALQLERGIEFQIQTVALRTDLLWLLGQPHPKRLWLCGTDQNSLSHEKQPEV